MAITSASDRLSVPRSRWCSRCDSASRSCPGGGGEACPNVRARPAVARLEYALLRSAADQATALLPCEAAGVTDRSAVLRLVHPLNALAT